MHAERNQVFNQDTETLILHTMGEKMSSRAWATETSIETETKEIRHWSSEIIYLVSGLLVGFGD